jgi:hypothetical protein
MYLDREGSVFSLLDYYNFIDIQFHKKIGLNKMIRQFLSV